MKQDWKAHYKDKQGLQGYYKDYQNSNWRKVLKVTAKTSKALKDANKTLMKQDREAFYKDKQGHKDTTRLYGSKAKKG